MNYFCPFCEHQLYPSRTSYACFKCAKIDPSEYYKYFLSVRNNKIITEIYHFPLEKNICLGIVFHNGIIQVILRFLDEDKVLFNLNVDDIYFDLSNEEEIINKGKRWMALS